MPSTSSTIESEAYRSSFFRRLNKLLFPTFGRPRRQIRGKASTTDKDRKEKETREQTVRPTYQKQTALWSSCDRTRHHQTYVDIYPNTAWSRAQRNAPRCTCTSKTWLEGRQSPWMPRLKKGTKKRERGLGREREKERQKRSFVSILHATDVQRQQPCSLVHCTYTRIHQ